MKQATYYIDIVNGERVMYMNERKQEAIVARGYYAVLGKFMDAFMATLQWNDYNLEIKIKGKEVKK